MEADHPYTLRKAQIEDQKHLLPLITRVLATYDLAIDPNSTDKDLFDLDAFYFANRGWFAVMEYREKEIIGSYGLHRKDQHQCELRKMYLDPAHQGKGLGRLMMVDAIKKARELGYSTMILETNRKLQKAINLYKKFGFTDYAPSHLSDRCDLV